MNEERLVNIETKIAYQEDAIEELNKVIYQQQQQIKQLETLCTALAGHVQALLEAGNANKPGHEKPPHY